MKEFKRVAFEINGWSYTLKVEEGFSSYLETESQRDFARILPDGRKTLLMAYVKAKYELFRQEQEIEEMIKEFTYKVEDNKGK